MILALDRDLIAAAVGRVAGQGKLAKKLGRHHHIDMGASLEWWQHGAVGVGEFIQRHLVGHFFDPRDHDRQYRRGLPVGGIDMFRWHAARPPRLVFDRRDHVATGLDAGLAVGRERPGIGRWGQVGGIDCQGLILMFQVQILGQGPAVDRVSGRRIGAFIDHFQVPPPGLDRVDLPVIQPVIQLGQGSGSAGQVAGQPAKRRLGKQPFQVPWAGLHAAPAHGAAILCNPVGQAFLAVGFPDLIAVEHQFRAGRDRARGAFTRAFVAGFAKPLQSEVNRTVMRHRHVGGHHARFQPWSQKRVQDHLANAADLAQTRQQQQRRIQHFVIHHAVHPRGVTQIAQMRAQHTANQREPQIGAHRLGAGDPVIAGCALHGLEPLIDDDRNRVVMIRFDRVAGGIVAVIGIVRAGRQPDRVRPQEICRGFQICGVAGGIPGRRVHRPGIAVLEQDKGAKRGPKGKGCGRFSDIIAVFRGLLRLLAKVTKQCAGKHVGTLGHPRHIRRVNMGGGGVHPFQPLERMGSVGKAPFGKGVGIFGIAGVSSQPGLPACWRFCFCFQRSVRGNLHFCCDCGKAETSPVKRVHRRAILDPGQPRRHGEPFEVHIACRH